MSDLMIQVLLYMMGMFLLGLMLGWLLWRSAGAKQEQVLMSEVKFWQSSLEQSRMERDDDISRIEDLKEEREDLRKQLAALAS